MPQLLKPTHPKALALQQEKPPQSEPYAPKLQKASTHVTVKTQHSHKYKFKNEEASSLYTNMSKNQTSWFQNVKEVTKKL